MSDRDPWLELDDERRARIRLAEAMGWVRTESVRRDGTPFWINPRTGTRTNDVSDLPNPFTDANDDYAVLEWMRGQIEPLWGKFLTAVTNNVKYCWQYRIGANACAALEVIDSE